MDDIMVKAHVITDAQSRVQVMFLSKKANGVLKVMQFN